MDRVPASIALAAAFGVQHDSPDLKEAICVRRASISLVVPASYVEFIDRPSKSL